MLPEFTRSGQRREICRTSLTTTELQRSLVRSGHRWIRLGVMVATWMLAALSAGRSVLSFSFGNGRTTKAVSSFLGEGRFRIVQTTRGRRTYGSSSLIMMPEGPEVRTLVDQLRGGIGKRLVDIRFLSGRYLGQRPAGFSDFATTMTPVGAMQECNDETVDTILDWNCKGKFIYILLDDGAKVPGSSETIDDTIDSDNDFQRSIWITLGMTGRFLNEARHLEDPSHGRWVLELLDESKTIENLNSENNRIHKIYYHDKRNFGTVKFCLSKKELEQKLKSLGPDVLALARQTAILLDSNANDDPSITIDDELSAKEVETSSVTDFLQLLEKQRNPRINICKLLMDQKKIAGVGNYILSEALYRANVDPFCGIDELSTSQRIQLFREVRAVCFESYRSQIESSSTSASVEKGYTSVGDLEAFSFELNVYGNQDCCPAGNPVIRETNGPHGRTIWYTEQQLFVSRHIREQRERELQWKQKQQSFPKENTNSDPWTITRRDGVEIFGENSKNKKELVDKSGVDEKSKRWNVLDGLTDPDWKQALEPYTSSSETFSKLQDFLQDEYSNYGRDQIYPPPHQIFSALNLCPLETVKVVILGQDPYHGPNQSTGLAFSVSKQISKIPPSLRNIFKELDDDYGMDIQPPEIRHGDLEGWAKQGVLMLNTVLTVRRGQANSHQKKGWEDFTDEIVNILRDRDSDSDKGMVFLLWGGPASQKAKSIVGSNQSSKHVVIRTSHPSPLGATKTASPFLTSRCFTRANAALEGLGEEPIDWYNR